MTISAQDLYRFLKHRYPNAAREIEPQPKGGILELTKKERESAWLVVV